MLISVKNEWWLVIFTNALRGALLNVIKWETKCTEESSCGPPSLAIRCSVEAVNRRHICLPSSLSDWALCLQHAPSSSLTQRVHFTSFSLIRMWCYTKTRLARSLTLMCVFEWLCVSLSSPCLCVGVYVCVRMPLFYLFIFAQIHVRMHLCEKCLGVKKGVTRILSAALDCCKAAVTWDWRLEMSPSSHIFNIYRYLGTLRPGTWLQIFWKPKIYLFTLLALHFSSTCKFDKLRFLCVWTQTKKYWCFLFYFYFFA